MQKEYKENFIKAGKMASEVRSFGKGLIQKGVSYQAVIKQVLAKISEVGGIPAFPPQMALNNVAAHFLVPPGQDLIFQEDLIKLDIGVCYQGAIGDCAVTVDLSGKHGKLIEAAEAALLAAEKSIEVGVRVNEIGRVIEKTIVSYGFKAVRNLCGHGLGVYKVHTAPGIPNFADDSRAVIKPGMTFAIEPFATNGKGMIVERGTPQIFSLIGRKAVSDLAKSLIEKMSLFHGLPFSLDDLISPAHSLMAVKLGMAELLKLGSVEGYAPLVEVGLVAQAENSVLVDESGKVIITTRS